MPSFLVVINTSVVLEKNLKKKYQCIFAILLVSRLGKGCGPSFEQTLIRFTKDAFCQVWFINFSIQFSLEKRRGSLIVKT